MIASDHFGQDAPFSAYTRACDVRAHDGYLLHVLAEVVGSGFCGGTMARQATAGSGRFLVKESDARVRYEVEQRGLRIERYGVGWRVHGPGVDLLVRDLSLVSLVDLDRRWPSAQ